MKILRYRVIDVRKDNRHAERFEDAVDEILKNTAKRQTNKNKPNTRN